MPRNCEFTCKYMTKSGIPCGAQSTREICYNHIGKVDYSKCLDSDCNQFTNARTKYCTRCGVHANAEKRKAMKAELCKQRELELISKAVNLVKLERTDNIKSLSERKLKLLEELQSINEELLHNQNRAKLE